MMAKSSEVPAREIGMRPHQKASHYSLWLMPTGEVRQQLAATILDLSQQYAAPAFEPHVTLAGGIVGPAREVVAKMAELATRIPPFTIRLTEVDFLDEYFRCLFVRVAQTQPIMKANQVARAVFSLAKQPAFMPHLSLLYADLPSGVKERIAASLGRQFELEFKVSVLHLYRIKDEVAAWRRAARFGLGLSSTCPWD
jgi:2'-5' RNA ligase